MSVILDPCCTPDAIEARSFAIIDAEAPDPRPFSGNAWKVARRLVHTTGDPSLLTDLWLPDAAIEAADIVLMDDNPLKLPLAIRIARKTLRIAKQNAVFAIGVKALVMVFSVIGIGSLWYAVFADVGVTILAVLNAMRTLKREKTI